jgi:hypothetical protein
MCLKECVRFVVDDIKKKVRESDRIPAPFYNFAMSSPTDRTSSRPSCKLTAAEENSARRGEKRRIVGLQYMFVPDPYGREVGGCAGNFGLDYDGERAGGPSCQSYSELQCKDQRQVGRW